MKWCRQKACPESSRNECKLVLVQNPLEVEFTLSGRRPWSVRESLTDKARSGLQMHIVSGIGAFSAGAGPYERRSGNEYLAQEQRMNLPCS
jgi:hypothetical protein